MVCIVVCERSHILLSLRGAEEICQTFGLMAGILLCQTCNSKNYAMSDICLLYVAKRKAVRTIGKWLVIKDGFGSKICALCLRMILFKREITRLVFWTTRNSDKHYQAH